MKKFFNKFVEFKTTIVDELAARSHITKRVAHSVVRLFIVALIVAVVLAVVL